MQHFNVVGFFFYHKLKRVPQLKAQTECHYNFLVWFEKKNEQFCQQERMVSSYYNIILYIHYNI